MTRLSFLLALVLAALQAQPPRVEILAAYYGLNNNFADVTEKVRARQTTGGVQLPVNGESLGIDPLPGTVKVLRLYYRVNGEFNQGEWRDGDNARVGNPTGGGFFGNRGRGNADGRTRNQTQPIAPVLTLIDAKYGERNRVNDVLARLQGMIQNNRLTVLVNNTTMGGDPAVAVAKQLTVVYDWQGQRFTVNVKEGFTLDIPANNATVTGSATATASPDGVCLFSGSNYQGASQCFNAGQEITQFDAGTTFRSVRFQGRVRSLELFQAVRFNGRAQRVDGDQPDLAATFGGGGGFFGNSDNSNAWVINPGSIRVGTIQ